MQPANQAGRQWRISSPCCLKIGFSPLVDQSSRDIVFVTCPIIACFGTPSPLIPPHQAREHSICLKFRLSTPFQFVFIRIFDRPARSCCSSSLPAVFSPRGCGRPGRASTARTGTCTGCDLCALYSAAGPTAAGRTAGFAR